MPKQDRLQSRISGFESSDISRRIFVAGAAGATFTRAPAPAGWRMRLSTSSVLFNSLPIEEACRRIADAGYDAVDLWQGERFKANHLDEALERLGPDGLKALLERNRLKLCSFTCFYIGIERYAGMLGEAGGGDGLYIRESKYYGTSGASYGATRPTDSAGLRRQIREVIESLKPSLELAEKHDFQVAIENHSSAILNSVDSFKAFLEYASHPRLWIALAPYHLQRDGIPVEQVIALIGKRMRFLYAWQNEPEVKQLPGFGSTDFTPWLKALAEVDYRGYVNPFMHENLRAAPGERQGMPADEMSKSVIASRRYLERCRGKF
jgi:sugar phosphate isomerase/epimerase